MTLRAPPRLKKAKGPGRAAALVLLAAVGCLRCASSPVAVRDAFPLDPREGLPGPYPGGVERGWQALVSGDARRAAVEFASVRTEGRSRAANIGLIEAQVLTGQIADAVVACAEALGSSDATLPLLVACGEAAAADGRTRDGYALYRHALARTSGRPGLLVRAEELKGLAVRALLEDARRAAEEAEVNVSRQALTEAVGLMPESADVHAEAGEIETLLGDDARALQRYREALELAPDNTAYAERAGDLALGLKDHALAVTLFDALAKADPAFAPRAAEARLAFRAANWPEPERNASRSKRLTRSSAAVLVWWMVPEVREAVVTSSVIASDVLSRRDSRAVMRALSLGLLESDLETHRANPDGALTVTAAARLLVRLLAILEPRGGQVACASGAAKAPRTGAEAVQIVRGCGLLESKEAGAISGPEFVRALDRVRALASGAAGGE